MKNAAGVEHPELEMATRSTCSADWDEVCKTRPSRAEVAHTPRPFPSSGSLNASRVSFYTAIKASNLWDMTRNAPCAIACAGVVCRMVEELVDDRSAPGPSRFYALMDVPRRRAAELRQFSSGYAVGAASSYPAKSPACSALRQGANAFGA